MEVLVKYKEQEFLVVGEHTEGRKSNDRDVPDDPETFEVESVFLPTDTKADLYFLFEQIEGAVEVIEELCIEKLKYA